MPKVLCMENDCDFNVEGVCTAEKLKLYLDAWEGWSVECKPFEVLEVEIEKPTCVMCESCNHSCSVPANVADGEFCPLWIAKEGAKE